MDPLTQGAFGAAFAQTPRVLEQASDAPRPRLRDAAVLGGLSGMAPDLDVLIQSSTDPLLFLEYHRHFTHALVFIPVGALVCALLLHGFFRRRIEFRQTYLFCLLGYASHGLLDACTTYGTQLLWPFSDARIAWNNVSVVDPLFTLPVLALVVAAAVRGRVVYARAAVGWAVFYLALGLVQQQRVEVVGHALAEARGHEAVRLSAKPGFGNLALWKVVYEADGHYYVDAVRMLARPTVFPGQRAEKLDLERHLPWLQADTVQAADVERFRWFSADYLALDPARPDHVVDVRYSVVPNEIQPLWGILLDPSAPPEAHVGFVMNRTASPAQREALLAMLFGAGLEVDTVADD